MRIPVDAGVLPGLVSFHVNVDWPRFTFSMFVVAALMGYIIYAYLKR